MHVEEKGIGVAGVAAVVVVIIIVIAAVAIYGIQKGSGELSPAEVRTHASKYLGKQITVEGYWEALYSPLGIMAETPNQIVNGELATYGGVGLLSGGKYRITGVLEIIPDNLSQYVPYGVSVYLEVTNVEPV
jgi:hypothetical protein